MSKPLIGISADIMTDKFDRHFVYEHYLDAVERAGGVPVILPPLLRPERVYRQLENLDGFLGIGSDDFDPSLFGQERHPHTRLIPRRRQAHDLVLLNLVWEMRIPALMICGSMQGINVVLGGDMNQHLESAIPHKHMHGLELAHNIKIQKNSRLADIIGSTDLEVNSLHHQAVENVPNSLIVVAKAEDGVIEALEPADETRPLLAVQWHPERIGHHDESKAIFEWLMDQSLRIRSRPLEEKQVFQISPFV